MRETVRLRFLNGLGAADFIRDVLWVVDDLYDFVEDPAARCVVFGPYGRAVPAGDYVRVGYFCENVVPDMRACEWGFGVPYEEAVGHPRYRRIEWHGLRPEALAPPRLDPARALDRRFCNFVYAQRHAHRERFFAALGRYRPVDAPGRSMNNMPALDATCSGDTMWERKRAFLSGYKFTIAFENDAYPGYNTEKLTDPLIAGSVPIYLGNPDIVRHFDPACFVDAREFLPGRAQALQRLLERHAREPFAGGDGLAYRAARRLRGAVRAARMRLLCGDFSALVRRVAELDADDERYLAMLAAPRLHPDAARSVAALRSRWIEVFRSVAAEARP